MIKAYLVPRAFHELEITNWGQRFEKLPIHFPKIHRSVLRKITIDILYFWDVYESVYEKKVLAEVQLVHAEQMSLYNFIILKLR